MTRGRTAHLGVGWNECRRLSGINGVDARDRPKEDKFTRKKKKARMSSRQGGTTKKAKTTNIEKIATKPEAKGKKSVVGRGSCAES